MRLLEHQSKARLARGGVAVPRGAAADTPASAEMVARRLGDGVLVKALVPANRRSKDRGMIGPVAVGGVEPAARQLLGSRVSGYRCQSVYVEEEVAIDRELYLAFSWGSDGPIAVASAVGGVDIEDSEHCLAQHTLDDPEGLSRDEAADLWRRALGEEEVSPAVVDLAIAASRVFADDAMMVEINPVAVAADGMVVAVGALIEMDANALFRHPEIRWRPQGLTEREAVVAEADRRLPGPSVRYVDLDGDTGLLVGGGGAGLYQHDLLVAAGLRPANHSDIGAGVSGEKLDVLIDAVLDHPNLARLLVGFNSLQMAPCDLIVDRLLVGLDRHGYGNGELPVVIRLEGFNSEQARHEAAGRPGLTYLPRGASLGEALDTLVRMV